MSCLCLFVVCLFVCLVCLQLLFLDGCLSFFSSFFSCLLFYLFVWAVGFTNLLAVGVVVLVVVAVVVVVVVVIVVVLVVVVVVFVVVVVVVVVVFCCCYCSEGEMNL